MCKPYNVYASGNAQKKILIKSNQIKSYLDSPPTPVSLLVNLVLDLKNNLIPPDV